MKALRKLSLVEIMVIVLSLMCVVLSCLANKQIYYFDLLMTHGDNLAMLRGFYLPTILYFACMAYIIFSTLGVLKKYPIVYILLPLYFILNVIYPTISSLMKSTFSVFPLFSMVTFCSVTLLSILLIISARQNIKW